MDRITVLVALISSLFAAVCVAEPLAFPGAVGQGARATGGRGGDVYHVTNLRDYNSQQGEKKILGSFRHAIRSAAGPRTIVFDVSGAIALSSTLEILKSNLTIAGQTSPEGITLWGYPVEITKGTDVIVRHLRIRTGDFHAAEMHGRPARGNGDLLGDDGNTFFIGGGASRVIVDHLSVSWCMDETLTVTGANDITVQNCLIGESLNDSYHTKGPHGYGSLIRGNLTKRQQADNVGGYTFYGNLWAHHRARNPSIAGQQKLRKGQSEVERRRNDLNLINNVIYDWGDQPTHRSTSGVIRVNMISNYYVNGPADDGDYIFNEDNPGESHIFHQGNYHDSNRDDVHDGMLVGEKAIEKFVGFEAGEDELLSETPPFPFVASLGSSILPAEAAYQRVVQSVGASLRRDVIDERTIDSLVKRTGNLLDTQEVYRGEDGSMGGIDDLPTTERPAGFDSDQDGMPDEFEKRRGLNPSDPKDGNSRNLSESGYTNLEVYLDSLVRLGRSPSGN